MEELTDFEFDLPDGNGLPWSEWLDGKTRQFNQGVDFDMSPKDFIRRARRVAWRRRLRVQARTMVAGVVILRAQPKETP